MLRLLGVTFRRLELGEHVRFGPFRAPSPTSDGRSHFDYS